MAIERTLSIIKPCAVAGKHIGDIYSHFENNGLRIIAARMLNMTPEQAGQFYLVHKGRAFWEKLVDFMSSGPIMVQVLEGENAIQVHRDLLGETDPAKALPGTIRARFGTDIRLNAAHGSDGIGTAREEIAFFFSNDEITPFNYG